MAEIRLTQADNGKTVTLSLGDQVLIQLTTNPSTGFDWVTAQLDSSLLLESNRSYRALNDAMGSPNQLTICFDTVAPGTANVLLQYQRHWEKNVPPLQIFEIGIEIG